MMNPLISVCPPPGGIWERHPHVMWCFSLSVSLTVSEENTCIHYCFSTWSQICWASKELLLVCAFCHHCHCPSWIQAENPSGIVFWKDAASPKSWYLFGLHETSQTHHSQTQTVFCLQQSSSSLWLLSHRHVALTKSAALCVSWRSCGWAIVDEPSFQ